MIFIKNTKILINVLIALALALVVVVPAQAQSDGQVRITCSDGTQRTVPRNLPEEDKRSFCDVPACDTGSADARESCQENYIQGEIRRRCEGMSADAAERCAQGVREELEGADSAGQSGNFEADCKSDNLNKDNCGIVAYIVTFTRILSGLVGIVVVIMIAVGGIQYAAAGPDPSAVVAARKRIMNAVIALVFYIFMFAFLQWLVPGGIF